MIAVVNIKYLDEGWLTDDRYVYVGRAGRGLVGTFGNPFVMESESRRGLVLAQYRSWLERRTERDPAFRAAVLALRDKTLVCFCAPRRCHGDVIAEWVEAQTEREDPTIDYPSAD